MIVKLTHSDKNQWRVYPEDDDFYLYASSTDYEARMFISQNSHLLKQTDCEIKNCLICEKN